MAYDLEETIVAVASAAGSAARGIVRLSGPQLIPCLRKCFLSQEPLAWDELRHPCLLPGEFLLKDLKARMPGELYLWPTTKSYTRQPMAEWHTIGSPPLLQATLRACCAAGARLAEPGEFTLRAFLAGRIDLTQAEAVLGVIDAAGKRDFEAALGQLAGGLGQHLHSLREQLLDLLAHLEAGLDFVEEDIQFISSTELTAQLESARGQVAKLLQQTSLRTHNQEAFRVVFAGEPNVGKSSLLNALAATAPRPPALVSEIPGTTRDYLTVPLEFDGIACLLIDTAGRESVSAGPAAVAQHQTDQQLAQAQLVLFCLDSSRPLSEWERGELAAWHDRTEPPRLIVLTKTDQPNRCEFFEAAIPTSTATGEGLSRLEQEIRSACLQLSLAEGGVVANTAVRSRESLRAAEESLQRALQLVATNEGEEFIAAEVRLALTELGKVVGVVYTEDILDRIFSRFCIGK